MPPRETKLPSAYLIVNFPSLSEVVEFSVASAIKLAFSSIKTSAPVIYPSTTTPSVCLKPSIVTIEELLPPSPEQVIVKLESPTVVIVTFSDPEVGLEPDQAPEAAHEEALDDDQVNVDSEPTSTEVGFAEKLIVGGGVEGAGVSLPPPPPPPPQATSNIDRARPT